MHEPISYEYLGHIIIVNNTNSLSDEASVSNVMRYLGNFTFSPTWIFSGYCSNIY